MILGSPRVAQVFQQEQPELWDFPSKHQEKVTSKDRARKDKHKQREGDGTGWSIPSGSHLQERGSYTSIPYPTRLLSFQGKREIWKPNPVLYTRTKQSTKPCICAE